MLKAAVDFVSSKLGPHLPTRSGDAATVDENVAIAQRIARMKAASLKCQDVSKNALQTHFVDLGIRLGNQSLEAAFPKGTKVVWIRLQPGPQLDQEGRVQALADFLSQKRCPIIETKTEQKLPCTEQWLQGMMTEQMMLDSSGYVIIKEQYLPLLFRQPDATQSSQGWQKARGDVVEDPTL